MRHAWQMSMMFLAAACTKAPPAAPVAQDIPSGALEKLSGNLEDGVWRDALRTGPFRTPNTSEEARPYSEARLFRDRDHLYLGVYAADEDIEEKTDAFFVSLASGPGATLELRLSPRGNVTVKPALTSTRAQIRTAVDVDGSIDDPKDSDEEWLVEAAIPWSLVPGEGPITALISRCDQPHGSKVACGEARLLLKR